jgi:hypothetical protein
VQQVEELPAFDAVGQCVEEEHGNGREDEVVDRALDQRQPGDRAVDPARVLHRQHEGDEGRDDDEEDSDPGRQSHPAQPCASAGRTDGHVLGQAGELDRDACEPSCGEACLDALLEPVDRGLHRRRRQALQRRLQNTHAGQSRGGAPD